MSIIDRFLYALEQKNKTTTDISKVVNLSSSTISNWKTRKTDPPAKYVYPICEYLNISSDWLLTGVGDMEKKAPVPDAFTAPEAATVADGRDDAMLPPPLTPDKEVLLQFYDLLTPAQKAELQKQALRMADSADNLSSSHSTDAQATASSGIADAKAG